MFRSANDGLHPVGEYVTAREAFQGVCEEVRESGATGFAILLLIPLIPFAAFVGIGLWFMGL